ncbi:MAG: hypothetical protein M1829_002135 [Trizodia sp. TS-e1964]|nr:MAG: hypothetical protein M1829_002135 [Trizodia sp. TS-e1964]
MALSKSTRIIILLSIDSAFFLLELLVGYSVHSLALVADSFHMLNDVISLCVGLWAVKVANQKTSSKMYTYGWQRAETLGALLNGVFLVALCLSIFLEAIQRFFEPQSVKNPKLVLIVGCCGLASNILGLFLFHEHGHSHGDGGHYHAAAPIDQLSAAEEGHNNPPASLDEAGNIEDILTFNTVFAQNEVSAAKSAKTKAPGLKTKDTANRPVEPTSPISTRKAGHRHRRRTSGSRSGPFASAEDINIHPASFRNDIIAAGRLEDIESATATDVSDIEHSAENTPLLCKVRSSPRKKSSRQNERHDSWHIEHNHNKPKEAGKKGHSHGDLNMKGILLHVMGDALGNIGVIGSALIIWLTTYEWRYYSDPIISLIITIIILASAIPLCLAASRILLQAVPAGINVDDIKADIQELPGIKSCHHLHVWQLSDTKLVASLHVEVDYDFEGAGSAHYMELARAVRKCLHAYGIHSSTIQPEFCLKNQHALSDNGFDGADERRGEENGNQTKHKMGAQGESRPGSPNSSSACLLECGDECGVKSQCCAPTTEAGDSQAENEHTH